jgi:hypothetical protein
LAHRNFIIGACTLHARTGDRYAFRALSVIDLELDQRPANDILRNGPNDIATQAGTLLLRKSIVNRSA